MKENYFDFEVHTHLTANLADTAEAVSCPVTCFSVRQKDCTGEAYAFLNSKTAKPSTLFHLPVT